jgi:thioredoxin 1
VPDAIRQFTDTTFEDELASAGPPLLLDLWAPWCGSCRFLAPAVEKLAEEYAGRLRVGKLDADAFPSVARNYDVHSVPTLLLFVNGAVALRIAGVKSKATLSEHLEPYLDGGSRRASDTPPSKETRIT